MGQTHMKELYDLRPSSVSMPKEELCDMHLLLCAVPNDFCPVQFSGKLFKLFTWVEVNRPRSCILLFYWDREEEPLGHWPCSEIILKVVLALDMV